MHPAHSVAVSVPAQWMGPTGRRSASPHVVRRPGGAMPTGQPRVHSSVDQSCST